MINIIFKADNILVLQDNKIVLQIWSKIVWK